MLSIRNPLLDLWLPPRNFIHRQPAPLRKLASSFHAPYRRSTQSDSLSDFSKRKEPRKPGPAIQCRRCWRRRWRWHLRRRLLGWQAPQDVQQLGRLLVQIEQRPHVVKNAKHHFIASAVQFVKRPDQFVAFTSEALALTCKPGRL